MENVRCSWHSILLARNAYSTQVPSDALDSRTARCLNTQSKERGALRLNGIARRMWFLTTSYLSLDRSALPQESRLR